MALRLSREEWERLAEQLQLVARDLSKSAVVSRRIAKSSRESTRAIDKEIRDAEAHLADGRDRLEDIVRQIRNIQKRSDRDVDPNWEAQWRAAQLKAEKTYNEKLTARARRREVVRRRKKG